MVKEVRNIRRQVLPHGLTVITEQMEHIRSASIGIWLETGSRDETPQSNGISHFIEHMVFKGTKHRTAEEIARQVDSIGGNMDAFTSKECICFNVKVLDEHVPVALEILTDLVLHPTFHRRGHRPRARRDPRRDQNGRGQSRLPRPRNLYPEFLERSSSRQADPRARKKR